MVAGKCCEYLFQLVFELLVEVISNNGFITAEPLAGSFLYIPVK